MDFNRFTEKLQEAVRAAQSVAVQHGNQQLDVEHLLLALLEQEGGLAPAILNKADIKLDSLRNRVQQEIDKLPKVSGSAGAPDQVYVTQRITKLLTQAEEEAKRLKDDYTSVEHVLLAATEDSGATGKLFREFGVTRERLMRALQEVRGSQRVTNQNPEATYQALEKYGIDLVAQARKGKLDPVIGRDEGAHVQGEDGAVLEPLGHIPPEDPLRQALDDGRLAHARLADQHGIVLGPPAQDLDGALEFALAPYQRIELPLHGRLRQIAAEFRQQGCFFWPVHRHLLSRAASHFLAHGGKPQSPLQQDFGSKGFFFPQHPKQQVLRSDVFVPEPFRFFRGVVEDPFALLAEGNFDRG